MTSKPVVLLSLGLLVPGICSAQSLKAGKWTGSAVPPGQDEVALTFDVTVSGESLGVVIHAGENGDFIATEGHYADKTISFNFVPGGPTVHCVLKEDTAGTYAGDCLGDDGSVATMKMLPPQSITPGKWTGSVAPSDGPPVLLTFDVTLAGDSLGVVIHAGEHGDFTVTEIRLAEKTLNFTFTPGPVVRCNLTLNDEGGYAGNCMEDDGSVAVMTMVPPKN